MAHKSALIDSLLQNSNLKFEFAAKEFGLRYINPPRFFGFRHVNPPSQLFDPNTPLMVGIATPPHPIQFCLCAFSKMRMILRNAWTGTD